ncbi:TerB N-terminal domain-containing protein [bacterium]|nr:TerB N-terminal domain-containing protein [bacterium]
MTNNSTGIVRVNDFEIDVQGRTGKLLYISDKSPSEISIGLGISITINIFEKKVELNNRLSDDPSTIFLKLPIYKPTNPEIIPHPDYFPSYAGLDPQQRWIYLNWLRDISKPINISYVFIYYYGLERHLLLGDFDHAFDEILFLQKHHENKSFLSYSNIALRYACLLCKRKDKLEQLYQLKPKTPLENFDLLLAHFLGYNLSVKNIIDISKNISGINRRYINTDPTTFEVALTECLQARYKNIFFPFASSYQIKSLPRNQEIIFANYSFPSELRTPCIPNFFSYGPFVNAIRTLLKEAHQKTKLLKKSIGKSQQIKQMLP